MTAQNPHVPKYRCYRPKGLAVVRLDGRDIYLGKFGSPESQEKYRRVIAEWLTRGVPSTPPRGHASPSEGHTPLSVNEVILAFWTRHAETHYRRVDGTPTGELANFRDSLRPLKDLYGATPAGEFGPLTLKVVRQVMIDAGLARTTVNQRVRRIIHLFKWAAENELVPPGVHHGLKAVRGLQRGRSGAKETPPVTPVPDELVEAVRPHVARQVWAMIELQRLTGMRPGEVVIMRTCDVDTSGEVWVYTPAAHKTAYRGRGRKVYLGPKAQQVLKTCLRENPMEFLFSPREAMEEFRRRQRAERKSRLYPSQVARPRKPDPKQRPGDRYTTRSYCHAIGYGCRRAGIESWHPHRLRHAAATRLRSGYDLDTARAVLGHSTYATTELYAEIDGRRAAEAMREVG
jgi:integrase